MPVQDLLLGDVDSVGYFVTYENNRLVIQAGVFYLYGKRGLVGPCACDTEFEIVEDVELFEQPMKDYLEQFVIA